MRRFHINYLAPFGGVHAKLPNARPNVPLHLYFSRRHQSTLSPTNSKMALSRSIERLADRLETPLTDDRYYRVIKLANQLEVLLVHDAETDKASAAMDVNVGNFSDEGHMPGMAHAVCKFSEHCISFRGIREF